MIYITPNIAIPESELKFSYIRASGPGGQNVNKVSTAVQLRFDISTSSLPEKIITRLLTVFKSKLTVNNQLIIKASQYRTQEQNKREAIERLKKMIIRAATIPKKRKKTKPTMASKQRRLNEKKAHAKIKLLRRNKFNNE